MLGTSGSYTPPGAAQASSGVPAKPLKCDEHRGQAYHPGLQEASAQPGWEEWERARQNQQQGPRRGRA